MEAEVEAEAPSAVEVTTDLSSGTDEAAAPLVQLATDALTVMRTEIVQLIDFAVAVRARSLPGIVLVSLHLLQTGDANSQQCIQSSPGVNKRQIIITSPSSSSTSS